MTKAKSFSKFGNTRYFQTIDSHLKAYFVGFISSDGCINSGRFNKNQKSVDRLSIIIHTQDIALLELLKSELNAENKIGINENTKLASFQIVSQELCDDLRQYGLDYRKTFNLGNIIPLVPEEFRNSLILGMLDGDGCLYRLKRTTRLANGTTKVTHYPVIIFNGTEPLLRGIAEYFGIETPNIRAIKSIYEFRVYKEVDRDKIIGLMYRNSPFFLQRKLDKYKLSQDETISSSNITLE